LPDLIRSTRLDNGIHVVTESMAGSHSAAIGFWVDAGSRDEEPAISGASHFLEHLLFKGTETRSAKQIAETVDAVGGDMNAFTTKEYTAFYVRVLDADLDLGLDILSDIMWSPSLRPEEVEAERQVIIEEILMNEDEPSDLVHELFTTAMYPGHPLGRPVLGDRSTIGAMTRDQIDTYFRAHYRPSAIVVAAAGNVEHERIVAGVERGLAGRTGDRPARQRAVPAPPTPIAVTSRPTEQAHLVVGSRALDRADDDRFTFAVLNHVLGGGMSSRLFQEIREKRGLVYSVYSYRAAYLESGTLAVYAGTSPAHTHEVLDLIYAELDRLSANDVSDHELAVAKGHVKGSMALSLEDSAGRMSRLGRSQLIHGSVMPFEELIARTDEVTLDDLQRVIDRVLGGDRVLAVVGPFEEDAFTERVA
jgi:predicted Zn-dependent peptidase